MQSFWGYYDEIQYESAENNGKRRADRINGRACIGGTYLNVPIPVLGDKTMIGLGNVFCILSGLLLGPVYGGAAAGIGSFIFDLVGGWASSAPFTLVFKFLMAFVCGIIAWGGDKSAKNFPG